MHAKEENVFDHWAAVQLNFDIPILARYLHFYTIVSVFFCTSAHHAGVTEVTISVSKTR